MMRATQGSTRLAMVTAGLVLAGGLAGCRVHVDKDGHGEDKKVQVDTPFGGVHVNTGQTTAADLGLPAYPGARTVEDKEHDKSANIRMGFGQWELRVQVVNYSTADSQDKVESFYKKALARYGDVIRCQNHTAVGAPVTTAEGLTCSDEGNRVTIRDGSHNHGFNSGKGLELKAGSKRHQHIVAFEDSSSGQTRFSLVAVDLPAIADGGSGQSD